MPSPSRDAGQEAGRALTGGAGGGSAGRGDSSQSAMAALRALLRCVRGPLRPRLGCAALRAFASGECGAEGADPGWGPGTAAAPGTPGPDPA